VTGAETVVGGGVAVVVVVVVAVVVVVVVVAYEVRISDEVTGVLEGISSS